MLPVQLRDLYAAKAAIEACILREELEYYPHPTEHCLQEYKETRKSSVILDYRAYLKLHGYSIGVYSCKKILDALCEV